MRELLAIITALMLIPLFALNLQCSTGQEPETVIVPVGEPGTGDPYDDNGDLGCGSDSSSATLTDRTEDGESMVLVTFIGTQDIWLVYVTLTEFQALNVRLQQLYGDDLLQLDSADIDTLHEELCRPPEQQNQRAQQLYKIFSEVLSDRMPDLEASLCR